VKHLHAMLDTTTMTDWTLHQGGRRRGQDPDHHQSLLQDSASSISLSPDEHGQGQGGEDLQDILSTRDARDRIKNHGQDRDRVECEHRNERYHDFHGPYYDQSA
jgi:hypothetical protein